MVAANRTENIEFNETNPPIIAGLPLPEELIARQTKRAQKGTKARPEQNKQAAQKIRNRKKAYEKYLKDATDFFNSENTLVRSRLEAGNEYIAELESEAARLRLQIRQTMTVVEDSEDSESDENRPRSALFSIDFPHTQTHSRTYSARADSDVGACRSRSNEDECDQRGISTAQIFGARDDVATPTPAYVRSEVTAEAGIRIGNSSKHRVGSDYIPDLDPGVALSANPAIVRPVFQSSNTVDCRSNPVDCVYTSMCTQDVNEDSDSGVEDLDNDEGSDVDEVDEGAGDLDGQDTDEESISTPHSPVGNDTNMNSGTSQEGLITSEGAVHTDVQMEMDMDVEDSDDFQSDAEFDGFRYFYARRSIKPSLIMSRQ